jgi:hypothetical protein
MSLWGCPEHGYVGPTPCCGQASLIQGVAGPPQQHVSSVIADGDLIAKLQAENAKLRDQLPDGMKHCTIKFIECPVGHGRLTATNWVQHECFICEINALREVLREYIKKFPVSPFYWEGERPNHFDLEDRARALLDGK